MTDNLYRKLGLRRHESIGMWRKKGKRNVAKHPRSLLNKKKEMVEGRVSELTETKCKETILEFVRCYVFYS